MEIRHVNDKGADTVRSFILMENGYKLVTVKR
jgi:hypothetical protein